MPINTLHFTSTSTAELIRAELERAFPGVTFEFNVETTPPVDGDVRGLTGLHLRWLEGPPRDEVEEAVARFQSLDWNPETGELEDVDHLEVNDRGSLQRVQYGVDYVFCDGPTHRLESGPSN